MTPSEALRLSVKKHGFESPILELGDLVQVDDLLSMANDLEIIPIVPLSGADYQQMIQDRDAKIDQLERRIICLMGARS